MSWIAEAFYCLNQPVPLWNMSWNQPISLQLKGTGTVKRSFVRVSKYKCWCGVRRKKVGKGYLPLIHSQRLSSISIKPRPFTFVVSELRRLLRIPWTARRPVNPKGNQHWIFRGTDAEAEAPVLWPPMQRADSWEKTLMLGKIEGRRRRGWQRTRWLVSITDSVDMRLSKFWGSLVCCSPWGHRVGHNWETEQQFSRLSCPHFW